MAACRPGDAVSVVADACGAREVLGWLPDHDNPDEIVDSALCCETGLSRRNHF